MWKMQRINILAAAVAVAMQTGSAMGAETATSGGPGVDLARAEALMAEAESLYNTPSRWTEAARLLERSADFRPVHDAAIYSTLTTAASIWVSAGQHTRAYQLARRAGEHAHARGAVQDAAHAFMNAAALAAQLGQPRQAEELVARARLLAESPLLSMRDRELILARDVDQGFAHLRLR